MSEAPLMLGVSGLRGIVGKSLTPEVAARFAGAVGAWVVERAALQRDGLSPTPRARKKAPRPVVVVGRDGRAGGEVILHAAIAGLVGAGCDVIDAGIAMTPTIGRIADFFGAAGLIITASHNPQEWNGMKVLVGEGKGSLQVSASAPGKELADELIARFRAGKAGTAAWDSIGAVTILPRRGGFLHDARVSVAIEESLGSSRRIRRQKYAIVLDCVGGSGSMISPAFLTKELGCRVYVEGAFRAGLFTHVPEPTRENLTALSRVVRKKKADIGFAQDPDADRLAIVNERGEYIGEEYTLVLAAESLLGAMGKGEKRKSTGKKKKGDLVLVTNLSTSRMIDDVAAAHGARVVRTPVGEANVVEAMKREKAAGNRVVLGGEGNGGVIWPEVTYVRDSLSAMALVLSLMARKGKSVSELVAGMPAYAIEKRKVEIARREHARPAVEKIVAEYAGQKIDLQDGIRVDWDDRRAWLHVRASNTEPIMRLIAEAPTAPEARAILDEAAAVIAG